MKVETHNHPTAISPVPGRGHRRRRRDPRRRRHRPRRAAQGRPDRLFGQQPAPAGHRRALGSGPGRQAGAHRQRAADHDRGPAGRRRVQQRVRPAQPGRLLPRLRAGRGRRAPRLPQADHDRRRPGQHRAGQTHKLPFGAGTLLVQLGGPGMRIGMGGGAASSMAAGTNTAALDFDSVQRGNPEIQRRAQEVINHCWALGEATRSWPSTTWAPAASATPSPNWWTAPARAPPSTCEGAAGRERPGAQGDLVQREPGALRAGRQPRPAAAVRADVRARALPVRGGRRGHRRAAAGAGGRPGRRACDRHADGRAAGQAAAMHRDVQRVRAASRRWT
jgi:hypothetical protein